MRTILLELEYEGTRYFGWQRPKKQSQNSISSKLTAILTRLTGEEIILFAGCKTEKGMHARYQTAHFQTASMIDCAIMKTTLNNYLPNDIAVFGVTEMPSRFHASLHALTKTYTCNFTIGSVENVFLQHTHMHLFEKPNISLMSEAAGDLVGERDFNALSSGHSKKKTIKELHPILFNEKEHTLSLQITASDFLVGMVQSIAMTLIKAGLEQTSDMHRIPAKAFTLTDVAYSDKFKTLMAHDDLAYQSHSLPFSSF